MFLHVTYNTYVPSSMVLYMYLIRDKHMFRQASSLDDLTKRKYLQALFLRDPGVFVISIHGHQGCLSKYVFIRRGVGK